MLRAQRKEIYNRFKNFLRTYVDTRGHNLYRKLIQDMCSLNKSSFEVSVLNFWHVLFKVVQLSGECEQLGKHVGHMLF